MSADHAATLDHSPATSNALPEGARCRCGYDLRSIATNARCPECGASLPDALANTPPSLSRRTASGAIWVGVGGIAEQFLGFLSAIFVARYLIPNDYGSAAMATVVISFATIFITFGLAPAIVSGRMHRPVEILSAHWLVSVIGVCFTAIVCAAAPVAAWYFENPVVQPILLTSAFGLLFGAWAVVPQAVLEAAGRFDVVQIITIAGQLLISVGAVLMAVLGAGVWALVVPMLVGGALRTIALTVASRISLKPQFSLKEIRPFLAECAHIIATSVADYVFFNADKIIVGKFFGTARLGLYTFANSMVSRSVLVLPRSFSKPLLSTMGQIREDVDRFDRAVVRANLAIARVCVPLSILGALLAPQFVHLVIGPRWDAAETLLRVFFVIGAVQAVSSLSGWIWMAMGKAQLLLIWTVVSNLALLGVFLLGAFLGSPESVAITFGVYAYLIVAPALYWVMRRICRLKLTGFGTGLVLIARDCFAAAGAVLVVGYVLNAAHAPLWLTFVCQGAAGALTYSLMFRFASSRELANMIDALPRRVGWLAARILRMPIPGDSPREVRAV